MFEPNHQITSIILRNIKEISSIITELNGKTFSKTILYELKKSAQEISTYASTSIEGNPLPLTDVRRILKQKPDQMRNTEKEIINYNNALEMIKRRKDNINNDLILQTHSIVMKNLLPIDKLNRYRQEPVLVRNPKTLETIYLPPNFEDTPTLMSELIDYLYKAKDSDPIITAGIFHKQFMLIHPFIDGNGRTGRLITTLMLKKMGLDTFELFSFENYYNTNVTKYFEKVGETGDYYDLKDKIDFTEWLEYFTEGILEELNRVRKEIEVLSFESPMEQMKDHHNKILNFINKYGSITDKQYSKLTDRAKATRVLDFKFLIQQNIIERRGKGKNTYYVSKD